MKKTIPQVTMITCDCCNIEIISNLTELKVEGYIRCGPMLDIGHTKQTWDLCLDCTTLLLQKLKNISQLILDKGL